MNQDHDASPDPRQNAGCLGVIGKIIGLLRREPDASAEGDDAEKPLPYAVSDRFMSHAERAFYRVLVGVVDTQRYVVCPKVNVADALYVKRPHENRWARNKIDRKHVDFLIVDTETMTPRLAVELDDASHQRAKRRERDAFMDRAFAAAGLPLLHVTARQTYDTHALAADIAARL